MAIVFIQDVVAVLTVNLAKLSVSLCPHFMQIYKQTGAWGSVVVKVLRY